MDPNKQKLMNMHRGGKPRYIQTFTFDDQRMMLQDPRFPEIKEVSWLMLNQKAGLVEEMETVKIGEEEGGVKLQEAIKKVSRELIGC